MRLVQTLFLLLAVTAGAAAGPVLRQTQEVPPLPLPVSNNAVVAVTSGGHEYLVSFAGLGPGRTHSDTLARSFVYDSATGKWQETDPVPGNVGRLAAVAAAAGDKAYVFGGYTVAEDGSEVSTPWVHSFDPSTGRYVERAPMPLPVDDAVAVTHEERYIYLISGWHDLGNVNLVQRYDTVTNSWIQATPTPGPAVFGHAGGIAGDRIVYCDGVAIEAHADRRRDFVAVENCFLGLIDEDDGRRIDWRIIPAHPGPPRYRMAASGVGDEILFIGGSENPYNYNGIGYDGEPSQPANNALLFDVGSGRWRKLEFVGEPTMDHRGLVGFSGQWVTIGGMAKDQEVTRRINSYRIE